MDNESHTTDEKKLAQVHLREVFRLLDVILVTVTRKNGFVVDPATRCTALVGGTDPTTNDLVCDKTRSRKTRTATTRRENVNTNQSRVGTIEALGVARCVSTCLSNDNVVALDFQVLAQLLPLPQALC